MVRPISLAGRCACVRLDAPRSASQWAHAPTDPHPGVLRSMQDSGVHAGFGDARLPLSARRGSPGKTWLLTRRRGCCPTPTRGTPDAAQGARQGLVPVCRDEQSHPAACPQAPLFLGATVALPRPEKANCACVPTLCVT